MILLNEAYRKILAVMARKIANTVAVKHSYVFYGVVEERVFYEVEKCYLFGVVPYKKHKELAKITLRDINRLRRAAQDLMIHKGLTQKLVNSNDELHVSFLVTDLRIESDVREIAEEYRRRSGEPTFFQGRLVA